MDDLADACVFILEKWHLSLNQIPLDQDGKEIFWINVGSQFEISIKDLATKIAEIIGYKGKINWDKNMPDGTPRKKLDTTRMNKLGWKATTSLQEGLKKTISSFKKI